ncbi:hypothetical protein GEV33_009302 [Tenebrio molitor]|uniref:Odorant receptor n=1 Tax=Tenebrio molitor TaxID=7067 RepID=A0A8J6H7M0_TENMO|nr:hypothetical protein GEV33_009302 [Tenebrio molitor]
MVSLDWKWTVKTNIYILQLTGLWPRDETYKLDLYTLWTLTVTILFTWGHNFFQFCNMFVVLNDLENFTDNSNIPFSCLLSLIKSYSLVKNMTTLKQLIALLFKTLFNPENITQRILIESILKLSGLWPKSGDTTRTRGAILLTVFLLASLLSQIINIFYILHDLTALTKTIYVLFTEALFTAKAYYFVKNTTLIEHLLTTLNTERFQPKDLKQVALIQPGLRFWKLVYNTFMVMCGGANLFWAIFPLLDNSGEDKPLPFLAWYPYNAKTSPMFELTYLHQMASYIYICFTHINIDTLIAALNTYIGGQFDILCDNLRHLHESNIHAHLVECVEAHKQILE